MPFLLPCWAKPEKALERVHLSPRAARGPGGSDRWLLRRQLESPIEPWSGVTKTPYTAGSGASSKLTLGSVKQGLRPAAAGVLVCLTWRVGTSSSVGLGPWEGGFI